MLKDACFLLSLQIEIIQIINNTINLDSEVEKKINELKNKLKLNQNAYLFKVDLDILISCVNESTPRYKKLPQFPEVQRDLAVIVPSETSWDDLAKMVKKGADNNVFNGCEVFDVYQGEHVQEGYKSVAFRIKLQDNNATLTDDAIEQQMANIRSTLKKAMPELSFRE